jgi:hypothetical protein
MTDVATPANSRYIALTTFRRDGSPVTTPVWAVPLEGSRACQPTPSQGG